MKFTVKRIITAIMLVWAAITVYQVLSKPQPVAAPQSIENAQANAQSFDQKLEQLATPKTSGNAPAEVHFTSDEVSAEVAQSMGALPAAPQNAPRPVSANPSPDAVVGPGQV